MLQGALTKFDITVILRKKYLADFIFKAGSGKAELFCFCDS